MHMKMCTSCQSTRGMPSGGYEQGAPARWATGRALKIAHGACRVKNVQARMSSSLVSDFKLCLADATIVTDLRGIRRGKWPRPRNAASWTRMAHLRNVDHDLLRLLRVRVSRLARTAQQQPHDKLLAKPSKGGGGGVRGTQARGHAGRQPGTGGEGSHAHLH